MHERPLSWLTNNGLALNLSNSEAIAFQGLRCSENIFKDVSVAGSYIAISSEANSLDVVLNKKLSFDKHVTGVCRACYFHSRELRHVRSSLTEDLAKTVAQSIIESRLDYCNSLWLGMSESHFDQLQGVQNTLARVVTGHTKFDHIISVLAELHWLPIRSRVTFMVATLVYKVQHFGLSIFQ